MDNTNRTDGTQELIEINRLKAEAIKKLTPTMKARFIADAMNRNKFSPMPEFLDDLRVIEVADGQLEPIEVDYVGQCKVVNFKRVRRAIIQYLNNPRNDFFSYEFKDISSEVAVKIVNFWLDYSPITETPKPILWANEEGLTFSRLPWDFEENNTEFYCPLFDKILERMSNAHAFECFIGSLFFEESDRQQYVWIHGGGFDGKGSLGRLLERIFGNAYVAAEAPFIVSQMSPFFTAKFVNKRIAVFGDCESYSFPTTGYFKSLTGGDAMLINPKNKEEYTTKLNLKCLFLSNEQPDIGTSKADLRRIIYCKLKETSETHDPSYEDRLWLEAGDFLQRCIFKYKETCPKHNQIPVDSSEAIDLAEENEANFQGFFDDRFVELPHGVVKITDFNEILEMRWPKKSMQKKFKLWLFRTYPVEKSQKKQDGKNYKVIKGIKIRDSLA
jgi:hypothetical protein